METARARGEGLAGLRATGPLRVLVVENDGMLRTMLSSAVRNLGHACSTARDAALAWALHTIAPFDVIFCAASAPSLRADELCRRIRERPGVLYTYFVLTRAASDDQGLLRAIRTGADDYMTCPLDLSDVVAQMRAARRVLGLYDNLREASAPVPRWSGVPLRVELEAS